MCTPAPAAYRDSTHSADVDYAELLPSLLQLNLTNYYIALAGEKDRRRVLKVIRDHLRPGQRIFVGVVAPIDPRIETAEEVRDRVLEASEYISLAQLGTTDDCGFSPFSDDTGHRVREDCRPGSRHRTRRRGVPSTVMHPDDEDQVLRSVALQNAQSILRARQRAEQELIKTKEALEEERRILERLNQTGAKLASKLDLQSVAQTVTDAATLLSGAQFGAFFYAPTGADGGALRHALHLRLRVRRR